jgi:hypothetical protein
MLPKVCLDLFRPNGLALCLRNRVLLHCAGPLSSGELSRGRGVNAETDHPRFFVWHPPLETRLQSFEERCHESKHQTF